MLVLLRVHNDRCKFMVIGWVQLELDSRCGVWLILQWVCMSITFACEESECSGYYAMQLVRLIVLQQLMCHVCWCLIANKV